MKTNRVLSLMGAFVAAGSVALANSSTITKTIPGFGGDVTVNIVFSEGKIVDVKVDAPDETEGIGKRAAAELPAAIIAAQSADVEGISGATVTSNAIRSAVEGALKEYAGETISGIMEFTPGTYTAKALGYGGMMTINVTVSENSITAIEIVDNKETPGVGENAVNMLPSRIVDAQSLAIDGISGCTATSGAIKSAVKDALLQAGAEESTLYAPIEKIDLSSNAPVEESADIIVVGAGPAGMASALAAQEQGASVILLEKMSFVGGASAISGGSVNSGGSKYQAARGLEDSVEIIYNDILKHGENQNDLRLARLYAENVGSTFDWLVDDLGIEFQDEVYFAAEHSVQRAFKSKSNPLCYSTIKKLKEDCLDRGIVLHLDTRANKLTQNEAGAVIGVKAYDTMTGQPYTFTGKVVILTTGGFGFNRELLSENLASCIFYGPVSSTGDGLKMATDIGAITQNMTMGKCVPDGFEYAPGMGKSTSNSNKVAFLNASAILLNYEGKRFADETGARERFAEEIRISPTHMNYLFMDQASWDIFLTKNATFSLEDAERWFGQNGTTSPIFIRNDTIEGAATAAGLDPTAVKATVDRYNELYAAGEDTDFGRTLVAPIGNGPYYIIEQKLRFATTLGGLRTSTDMEVYSEGDTPISGLYAAGEIVGGAQGANALVGGNNGWALTSGRLAGTNAGIAVTK